ncbi:extracellular solute-binding protein [Natrinema longum]|uniref:Extracellular solute-binding protein n=1 Tax=Natrinema longum TaxID=370324 RepID=A0A8A2U930_9EURY|nr:extracellular solute-binding protein [Natrinema longum]MBZ6493801.1 extracellular solute-binding protein [Natrinema longum]QSW84862.1 extracellular solute-binding protein [Natrinema longum]
MDTHDGRGRSPSRSRRELLAGAGGLTAGLVGTAGCLGSTDGVRVLAAGSLAIALEERIGPAFEAESDVHYEGEYHGTNAVLRLVEDGTKYPDVVIGADIELLRDRLYPDHADWDASFAANEVVIAYEPETELGACLETDRPWYECFGDADEGAIAISDPDLDPLGYRALLLFELAEREHGLDGFRDAMADTVAYVPDETQLLADVESGNRACAVAYSNMAAEREVAVRRLSDAYNFGAPAAADRYAQASYTTADGHTVEGSPVVYNATVRTDADDPVAGREFVAFLLENDDLLTESGLRVDDSLPRFHGDPPEAIKP